MFTLQRHVLLFAVAGLLIATTLFVTYTSSWENASFAARDYFTSAPTETRRLHLILPATDSTLDFCRFLLSSSITGYPDPILLGWHHHSQDGKESHLFKVSEGLAYLNSLPKERDSDLVLMLDAYDIWLLLRPEVIISRYNKIIAEQAGWLEKQGILGKLNGDVPVENTLLFGADKICWPRAKEEPGCWAGPDSPMRKQAYGPDTDSWMVPNRPKWLNSGTLIGPAGHMRDMFNATMDNVQRTYSEGYEWRGSDQYYFMDVWAEQELTRRLLRDGEIRQPVVDHEPDGREKLGYVPDMSTGRRSEYRLSLDYNIDLFQTAAGFTEYLTWMSFNHTTSVDESDRSRRRRIDELELPGEILNSRAPFKTRFPTDGLPAEKTWKDVTLGLNVVQQTVWPLFHVTGDKYYRDTWWHYVWFHEHAEALLTDATRPLDGEGPEVLAVVDGVQYIAADMSNVKNAASSGRRGGGWSSAGDRLEWHDLCGAWEKDSGLFLK